VLARIKAKRSARKVEFGIATHGRLQWGRARAGAESPLLLLPLVQARNTTIAIACAVWTVFLLMLSREIVIVV